MKYSKNELENAIRRILNNDALFESLSLPIAVKEAAIRAFVCSAKYTEYDMDVVRAACIDLDDVGYFVFWEE